MSIRLYAGDSHGNFEDFNSVVERAIFHLPGISISEVVSVGDFGYWPCINLEYKKPNNVKKVRWIDGNHENFLLLKAAIFPNEFWECEHIPRGTFHNGVFFMGGATSVDRQLRTAGKDWFPEENISYQQFYDADALLKEKSASVQVMCAHDTILRAYSGLLGNKSSISGFRSDAEALEQLFLAAKPKVYVHGHHHVFSRYRIEDTQFVSLDLCHRDVPNFLECTIAIDDDGTIIEW